MSAAVCGDLGGEGVIFFFRGQNSHQDCFGTIKFVKVTKQSLYKANSFACSLANRDKPVAAALQRKCFGGILFVIVTKITTKITVPRNYFVIISARMVHCLTIVLQATL